MAAPGQALRAYNRARLLTALQDGGTSGLSRAGLEQVTGLARSTVSALVSELVGEGVVAEQSAPVAGRTQGRPPRRLCLVAPTRVVVAVDLGHSHCHVALVEVVPDPAGSARATATVLARASALLDVDASPEAAVDTAERLTRRVLDRRPDDGDGDGDGGRAPAAGALGLPAPVDVRTGVIGDGNVLRRWVGHRPAAELGERLGLPFALDNDANLGALAEMTFGEPGPVQDLIYVKAATGIGAGLIVGGQVLRGRRGRAGEIGHVPVEPTGTLCRCGNRGCLETLAAVPQVLAAFGEGPGSPVDMAAVAALVESGDPGARRVVVDAGRLIGRALADVVNVLNPERVVLGGALASAGEPLAEGVRESIGRYTQPDLARDLDVGLSTLTESPELLGAAALAASTVASS